LVGAVLTYPMCTNPTNTLVVMDIHSYVGSESLDLLPFLFFSQCHR